VDSPEPKQGSAAMSQAPIQKFAELELKDLITFADQCTSKEAELKYWSAYLGSSCQLEFTSLYERRFTSLTASVPPPVLRAGCDTTIKTDLLYFNFGASAPFSSFKTPTLTVMSIVKTL
jgi:hypothetical protein